MGYYTTLSLSVLYLGMTIFSENSVQIQTEKPLPLTYEQLISEKDDLISKEITAENAEQLLSEALALQESFKKIPGYSNETAETVYPNRQVDFNYPITNFLYEVITCLDFCKLSIDLVPDATHILIEKHVTPGPGYYSGLICSQLTDQNYFQISHMTSFLGSSEIDKKIIKLIIENRDFARGTSSVEPKIEDQELNEMIMEERKIFKIHLNLAPEKRAKFLELYFENIKDTRKKIQSLSKELSAKGEVFNREVQIKNGLGSSQLQSIKFKGYSDVHINYDVEYNYTPDFVFYLPKDLDSEITSMAVSQTLEVIASILKEIDGVSEAQLARYSMPYTTSDGEILNCLSVTQGDSDFKNYLKRIGRLDEFFDKEKNYSVAL